MPLVFQVQVNDDDPIRAGGADIGVLTSIVTYVAARNELGLSVGGLVGGERATREHAEWLERPLRVGDRVVITVTESSEADPPARRTPAAPDEPSRT